jgi:hypothetical protein
MTEKEEPGSLSFMMDTPKNIHYVHDLLTIFAPNKGVHGFDLAPKEEALDVQD